MYRYLQLLLLLILLIPLPIHAQSLYPTDVLPSIALDQKNVLKDDEYQLELSPLEPSGSSEEASLGTNTLSPEKQSEFNSRGYIVDPIVFTGSKTPRESYEGGMIFSISNARVDFGTIAGPIKKNQEVRLSLSAEAPYGYEIIAIQETPFESGIHATIAPTQCNGKQETCTFQLAKKWTTETSYGWGYSLKGVAVPADFVDADYFRPFKILEQVRISAENKTPGLTTTLMKFKLNTSPKTPEGNYATTIRILVLPKL